MVQMAVVVVLQETKKETQQLNVGAADTSISSSLKEDDSIIIP
jgi:hypothetical protein